MAVVLQRAWRIAAPKTLTQPSRYLLPTSPFNRRSSQHSKYGVGLRTQQPHILAAVGVPETAYADANELIREQATNNEEEGRLLPPLKEYIGSTMSGSESFQPLGRETILILPNHLLPPHHPLPSVTLTVGLELALPNHLLPPPNGSFPIGREPDHLFPHQRCILEVLGLATMPKAFLEARDRAVPETKNNPLDPLSRFQKDIESYFVGTWLRASCIGVGK